MLAALLENNKLISLKEVPDPNNDGENVVIRVSKVGICGSDIHMWDIGEAMEGKLLGHEYCGVVADPGAFGSSFKIGDRVTSITTNPDFDCAYCNAGKDNLCEGNNESPGSFTDGALSELFVARGDLVRKLPDTVSDDEAAMAEPISVALHAVRKARVKKGDKVLISGAGAIGAFIAQFAQYFGASKIDIVNRNTTRLERLKEIGVGTSHFDANMRGLSSALEESSDGGYDVFFDCIGIVDITNNFIDLIKKDGTLMLIGIDILNSTPIDLLTITLKEYHVVGCYAYTAAEFDEVLDIMATKKIDFRPYAGPTFTLANAQEAFQTASSRTTSTFKVFISPNQK